ncbi:hypothetical protein J7354_01410 [Sulfitobacter sp. R18_2]|uniref:DUF6197 family protein n=1 Tax=Sulfitobacter sp. R18_2 TaxID=2821105 RepID=UPI001AD9EE6C|nr:hypothetical protein [Sulfitobacter sp. R18_2]MBO9437308.1 hypothetical protein [Sulfitobacter sp. R18_2]
MSKEIADLLRKAKARIGTPEKWGKGEFFTDHPGSDLRDFDEFPSDCPACAYGASAWATGSKETTAVDLALEAALPEGFGYVNFFNDHPAVTHDDIMALFDRAIAAEEATS